MTRHTPNWLQAGSYAAGIDRDLIGALWPAGRTVGLAVSVQTAMTLAIAAGQAAVPSPNNTGSILCTSDATENVTLAAAPGSGSNRIDLVVVQPRGADWDGTSNIDFIFANVTGTAAATPVAPATPPGTLAIASVYVAGGTANLTGSNITDLRPFGLSVAGANLPPAVGAAAPLTAFTDTSGELWIAKGGVYGGAYRRARDTLRTRVYSGTQSTTANTWTSLNMVNTDLDPYGVWGQASGYTCPVAGHYDVGLSLQVSATAAAQTVTLGLRQGAPLAAQTPPMYSSAAQVFGTAVRDVLACNAGDVLLAQAFTSVGMAIAQTGNRPFNFLTIKYLGPGPTS
jgi:hypothetical protein